MAPWTAHSISDIMSWTLLGQVIGGDAYRMTSAQLTLLAGAIGAIGYAPYIKDTVRGITRPQRAAWHVWLFEYAVLFGAQIAAGATHALWIIGLQLLGVIIICVLSWRRGVGGYDTHTRVLFVCVAIALAAWYFSRSASFAIFLLIGIEMVGVILTARKVFKQPGTETLITWAAFVAAGVLGVIALGYDHGVSPIVYVYPAALAAMGCIVIAASWLGSIAQRQRAAIEAQVQEYETTG